MIGNGIRCHTHRKHLAARKDGHDHEPQPGPIRRERRGHLHAVEGRRATASVYLNVAIIGGALVHHRQGVREGETGDVTVASVVVAWRLDTEDPVGLDHVLVHGAADEIGSKLQDHTDGAFQVVQVLEDVRVEVAYAAVHIERSIDDAQICRSADDFKPGTVEGHSRTVTPVLAELPAQRPVSTRDRRA
jgi:hypothetical protein